MALSKLIAFDLDGTLFRTETVDIEAFNQALISHGYQPRNGAEILSYIGFPLDSICKQLLATDKVSIINEFKKEVMKNEAILISSSGELYPGTADFLGRLKKENFNLCICSNGNQTYVEAIAQKFDFYAVFDKIWYENNNISKSQALAILKQEFAADSFIMVGDRAADIEAAKANSGISIGVSYGYGKDEILNADYMAESLNELEAIIRHLYHLK